MTWSALGCGCKYLLSTFFVLVFLKLSVYVRCRSTLPTGACPVQQQSSNLQSLPHTNQPTSSPSIHIKLPRALEDAQRTLRVIPDDGGDGVRIAEGAVAGQEVLVALQGEADVDEGVSDAVGGDVAGVAAVDQVGDVGGLHAEGGNVGGGEVGVGGVEGRGLVVVAGADGGAGAGDGGCRGGGDGGDGAGEGGGDGLWWGDGGR